MVTNHWVSSSADVAWVPNAVFANLDIAIPAHATMKRFLVRRQIISGTTNGANLGAVGNFYYTQDINIVLGDYLGHNLFTKRYALPAQTVGLYDVVSANRIYSQLLNGGDETFAVDQRASYGTRSGAGFTMRCQCSIFVQGGFTGLLSNARAIVEFRALYETLP